MREVLIRYPYALLKRFTGIYSYPPYYEAQAKRAQDRDPQSDHLGDRRACTIASSSRRRDRRECRQAPSLTQKQVACTSPCLLQNRSEACLHDGRQSSLLHAASCSSTAQYHPAATSCKRASALNYCTRINVLPRNLHRCWSEHRCHQQSPCRRRCRRGQQLRRRH